MKRVLIASFDMEVGGVERSLISLLENFNYEKNDVDLMLYRHCGDFMKLLPNKPNLLSEVEEYASFRKSIADIFKEGKFKLGFARLYAKIKARSLAKELGSLEPGNIQMQLMWKYSINKLPKLKEDYDVAISYLWPHYFVAEKVRAKKKIAWIHTDFSTIETDIEEDLRIWKKFNNIIAVSEECKNSFLKKYPSLKNKVIVMENINSPQFIQSMSQEEIKEEITNYKSFKLVSVARLSHAKGIDNAVRALKILHDRGLTNIKWYVVGYGGDEELIKQLIKENNLEDKFILLGKKVNPYPYIKACDLYVQPSRYEGKAVTVTEAQILEKPVIITNYATANSQLRNGFDGYITELSVEGIADGIEKVYRDNELRNRLKINCKNSNYGNSDELNKLYRLF